MATYAGVAPALPLPPSVREQAPYHVHNCFILGKNSHDHQWETPAKNVGKYAESALCATMRANALTGIDPASKSAN
ncbi:TPA: hypothetical protein QDC06_008123 [Burkholderia cepacia]|nr:hypothetical protein [Burkholderia cepacia]